MASSDRRQTGKIFCWCSTVTTSQSFTASDISSLTYNNKMWSYDPENVLLGAVHQVKASTFHDLSAQKLRSAQFHSFQRQHEAPKLKNGPCDSGVGWFATYVLVTAMNNQCTKVDVSSFTHCIDRKGIPKFTKGVVWDRPHTTSYQKLSLSCIVSKIQRVVCHKLQMFPTLHVFGSSTVVTSFKFHKDLWQQKTSVITQRDMLA